MKSMLFKQTALLSIFALAVVVGGCSQQGSSSSTPVANASHVEHEGHDHGDESHGGWWCVEHGVPEEDCSMCSAKAADNFKAKGDWCEEHSRAESQCFICEPSRAEKFAKLYVAKVGHEPPKPEVADE
ncbi:MAG: RND transporter [Planctomycetaceae bacterium]|nr:hypothetical protein [Planctomycetales bacterium]MCB9927575.1 RND transporter [Planctomycetaceae bacterium]